MSYVLPHTMTKYGAVLLCWEHVLFVG